VSAKYVLGFVFDMMIAQVILVRKTRGPKTALGWNGVGGHIDEGEEPHHAMTRELLEEANVLVEARRWVPLDKLQKPQGDVATPAIFHARTRSDEEIQVFHTRDLPPAIECAGDAQWFIARARVRLRKIFHPDWNII
jgi:8-oxo-dGTP pyrophosphatase MutT (NUDIX family)